jgi:oligoribonuclease
MGYSMAQSKNNLIWIDLEMTGLDTAKDYIIEIATIITDNQLNILEEGPIIAIHQDDSILHTMDEWNTTQHSRSGLVERIRNSTCSTAEAEQVTLEFIGNFVQAKVSPMCGNSICQDRRFLYRLMPELEQYFHYRNLDVSTVKELIKYWYPDMQLFEKDSNHRANDDIRDSISELKFYRENYFINH